MTDPGDERVDAPLDQWTAGAGEDSVPGSASERGDGGEGGERGDGGAGGERGDGGAADDERSPPISPTPVPDLPEAEAEFVALGVELLANLEHDTLTVAEAVDRIETLTTDPRLTREILEAAEAAGAIERDGETVTPRRGTHVSFDADVVVREGEFDCRRCGTTLTEGHFLQLDSGELGAFGSSCIRKVTGRE